MHKEQTKTIDLNFLESFSKVGSFVLIGIFITALFLTSTNYIQLAIATISYPLFAWLIYKVFPENKKAKPVIFEAKVENNKEHTKETAELLLDESRDTIDIDKRTFLKLIGTAGISFFLLSLFTRRAESVFFGKSLEGGVVGLEDESGKRINPSEKQPTDGYKISEIDTSDFTYYGFINKTGGWYIMREDPASGSFRYIRGENQFPTKWETREKLNYDYFNVVFA